MTEQEQLHNQVSNAILVKFNKPVSESWPSWWPGTHPLAQAVLEALGKFTPEPVKRKGGNWEFSSLDLSQKGLESSLEILNSRGNDGWQIGSYSNGLYILQRRKDTK